MYQINILWIVLYFVAYGVLTGVWNHVLKLLTERKMNKMTKANMDVNDAALKYSIALLNTWYAKASSNLELLPLWNVACLLLWPVYLPTLIITAIYYLNKYYTTDEQFEKKEEVEDIA